MSNTHWEFKIRKPGPIPTHVKMIVLVIVSLVGGMCIGFQHGYEFGTRPAKPTSEDYPQPVGELPCIARAINDSNTYQRQGAWAIGYGRLDAAYTHPLMLCNGPDYDGGFKDPGDLTRLAETMRCYPCENIPKDITNEGADSDYREQMYQDCLKNRELFNGDQTK